MKDARITVTGNVAAPPRLHRTKTGDSMVTFRIGHTPRKKDSEGNWSDADTLWFSVAQFRNPAENAFQSLKVGDRVVVTGRLTVRAYTNDAGQPGTALEIDADTVGLDLTRYPATVVKPAPVVASVDPGDLPLEDEEELVVDRLTGELVGVG